VRHLFNFGLIPLWWNTQKQPLLELAFTNRILFSEVFEDLNDHYD
jgi:hypothetical protein